MWPKAECDCYCYYCYCCGVSFEHHSPHEKPQAQEKEVPYRNVDKLENPWYENVEVKNKETPYKNKPILLDKGHRRKPEVKQCQCGVDKCGGGIHQSYCDKYEG